MHPYNSIYVYIYHQARVCERVINGPPEATLGGPPQSRWEKATSRYSLYDLSMEPSYNIFLHSIRSRPDIDEIASVIRTLFTI